MSIVFELNVEGMKCVSCSDTIEKELKKINEISNVNFNFFTQKILITTNFPLKDVNNLSYKDDNNVEKLSLNVKVIISELGFKVLSLKIHDSKKNENTREIDIYSTLDSNSITLDLLKDNLNHQNGIVSIEEGEFNIDNTNFKVIYNYNLISSFEIIKKIESTELSYIYKNKIDSVISEISHSSNKFTLSEYIQCFVLTLLSIFLNMILAGSWIENYLLQKNLLFEKLNYHFIICFLINSIIVVKFGMPIYKKAYYSIISSYFSGMDLLISLGSISAIFLGFLLIIKLILAGFDSDIKILTLEISNSFGASAIVVGISTIGSFVENLAKNKVRQQSALFLSNDITDVKQTIKLVKTKNQALTFYDTYDIDQGLLEVNDIVELKSKDFILCDSIVIKGSVKVNEGFSYGYDIITVKNKGDKILSGSIIENIINEEKVLIMVENNLENSKVYYLMDTMLKTFNQKIKILNFVDKIIKFFVPTIVIIALFVMSIWTFKKFYGDLMDDGSEISIFFIIERFISMLVVSCPCAFGLAIPLVTTISISIGLKSGILIKNISSLSEIYLTKKLVFDKTGTLTEIIRNIEIDYINKDCFFNIFNVIELMEKHSKHPVGEALYNFSIKQKIEYKSDQKLYIKEEENNYMNIQNSIDNTNDTSITLDSNVFVDYRKGIYFHKNGIESKICTNSVEAKVFIGSSLNYDKYNYNENIVNSIKKGKSLNHSIIIVVINNNIEAVFHIDTFSNLRFEAKGLIEYLKKNNIQCYILSGDSNESVNKVARELAILPSCTYGEADANSKKNILTELKKDGFVMMIGDGVNDVLSLSTANFGISFNASSQLNFVSSDIVIVKEDLTLILSLLKLSKYSFIFICLNILWAFSYNFLMIPMSSGLFMHYLNFHISPQLGSFLMLLSSIIVILNSNLLWFINIESHKSNDSCNSNNLFKTRNEIELNTRDVLYTSLNINDNANVINVLTDFEKNNNCCNADKKQYLLLNNNPTLSSDETNNEKVMSKPSCCMGNSN